MNKLTCFSGNTEVQASFKDYMNHYMSIKNVSGLDYDKTVQFADKEKAMNKALVDEVRKVSNINFSEGSISMEMWAKNPVVSWAAFAVVNSLIDAVIPDVLNSSMGIFAEQRYAGWGDNFVFEIEPNDLFYVSKAGHNQRTVEFQRQYNTQISITPEVREITVQVNLYRVLCGMDSLAKFIMKAILSIEHQITKDVYTAFDTAMSDLPTTPVDGALQITGWSQESAVALAQKVTAWNHGAPAVFVGTQAALQHVLPDDANYRYFLDSEYATLGYVKNAFGYNTLILPAIADWQNPFQTVIRDDVIYVLSPSAGSLLKICYEGSTVSNTLAPQTSANLTETNTIAKSYGIGFASNRIAGRINLS